MGVRATKKAEADDYKKHGKNYPSLKTEETVAQGHPPTPPFMRHSLSKVLSEALLVEGARPWYWMLCLVSIGIEGDFAAFSFIGDMGGNR